MSDDANHLVTAPIPLSKGGADGDAVDFQSPLQADVLLLSTLLTSIIKEHAGVAGGTPAKLASTIESILTKSREYFTHPSEDTFNQLVTLVRGVEGKRELVEVARVFHEFLTLADIAERQHRVRRWRGYRRGESSLFFRQTCQDAFKLLMDKGFSPATIRETLMNQQVELVLTAHPTQAARRTLLDKYFRIAELLETRDKTILTPEEQTTLRASIRREILAAWRTNTVRRIKPTPEDEARNALMVLEASIWTAVPRFGNTLDHALESIGVEELPADKTVVTFGSWIGGDRDGNPYVTSTVTNEILKISHWRASTLIYNDIATLMFELSMTHASP
ncbi:hypothetical protein HK104_006667, partial [Borealophlyctis nickersoniae]